MYKILSLPTLNNFGGLLQSYALQRVVSRFVSETSVIYYRHQGIENWFASLPATAKIRAWYSFLKIILGARYRKLHAMIEAAIFHRFRKRFIKFTPLDAQRSQLPALAGDGAFIVGSDQVWRCEYARSCENMPFFFLSFTSGEQRQRSIAYAASFGSYEWEGTPEETEECARLLRDFKAVSVREHSGIRICREVFGVEAVQMPDPTLLLEVADYSRVIRRWWTRRLPEPFMAVYLLDETEDKRALTQAVAGSAKLYPQQLTAHGDAPRAMDRIPLSVPQWLRCMRDCECVLTDSFHGCVFAIIFNKPFVCLGNAARGSARFDSLLGTFGLQERLLTNPTAGQVDECMRIPIDWERVNAIRRSEQQRAFDFLKQNLEKD